MSSSVPAVAVLTAEQLAELVRGAVAEALAAQREDSAPALLDRTGLARALGVGASTVHRLRRDGMPCVMIGDAPRFVLADCLDWLQQRGRTENHAPPVAHE